MSKRIKAVLWAFSGLSLIFGLLAQAPKLHAAQFFTGDGSLPVMATNASENWYAAGSTLVLDQPVGGDAYIAGSTITVTDKVGGDLVSAGSILTVTGNIAGDARLAGSAINLNSTINGDALVAAAQINQGRNGAFQGDTHLYAAKVTLNGLISKPLIVKAEKVVINGIVAQGATITAESLAFGPQAQISGVINYKGKNAATLDANSKILPEQIKFTRVTNESEGYMIAGLTLAVIGLWCLKVAMMIFASWLFATLWPKFSSHVVAHSRKEFWTTVGIGLITVIVLPIACIILIATLFGAVFGFIGIIFMVLLGIFARLLAGPLVGYALSEKASWFGSNLNWKHSVGGTVILQIIGAIPFIGWIAKSLAHLSIIGALVNTAKDSYWTNRK